MGQKFPYPLQDVSQDFWIPDGVAPFAAEAFRTVAARRAPILARLYSDIHNAALGAHGEDLRIAWRRPWPNGWRATVTWREAKQHAIAAMASIHPTLGERAQRLMAMGRVIQSHGAGGVTKPSDFGPPWVRCAFDGSTESAVTLAHELGHATQMTNAALSFSMPAPVLVLAEIPAHVAERGFHHVFANKADGRAALARECDDLLAMLVRHPARDAVERAGAHAWPVIAARFAPDLDWSAGPAPITPRAVSEPGSTLAYAMAAAIAMVAFERCRTDSRFAACYLDWISDDPMTSFEAACALLGASPADEALYEAAYDLAALSMARRFAALGAQTWSDVDRAPISGA